jgi:transcriptional regulator with XRE-family HTH domain
MANLSASDLAGRRIRETRQRRGWTAKELAERCAEAGAPHITPTVITNLETRRRATREITVDEVLVLAHALQVAPLQLMVPLDAAEALEVLPGVSLDAPEAVNWIAGDPHSSRLTRIRSLRPQDTNALMRWSDTDSILTTIRQIRYAGQYVLIEDDSLDNDPPRAPVAKRVLPLLADRLWLLTARMESLGYAPPRLAHVRDILRRRGLPSTLEEWRRQPADADDPADPDDEA